MSYHISKKYKKIQKNTKKLTLFVDYFFKSAYNSASTQSERVLKSRGGMNGTF